MYGDYFRYVMKTKEKNDGMYQNKKQWWLFPSKLMMRGTKSESIPPPRDSSGKWALTSCEKADLLASCFGKKFKVPEIQI